MTRRRSESAPEGPKGCPTWMVTYSDTVTLLLTFFVMMLTFSTPSDEDYNTLARGFLYGARALQVLEGGGTEGITGAGAAAPADTRLMASRLDREGAENPPLLDEAPLWALQFYYRDMDIAHLKEVPRAQTIQAPLACLFEADGSLSPDGREVLDRVIKVRVARPGRTVVRVHAEAPGAGPALAAKIAQYLRLHSPAKAGDVDVCGADGPGLAPLVPGAAEIALLEG